MPVGTASPKDSIASRGREAFGNPHQGIWHGCVGGAVPFSTSFIAEIINTPRYRKVEKPTMGLYDGTTDLEEHLGVYKAQMYVQDVDDSAYCRYFPATLKEVA